MEFRLWPLGFMVFFAKQQSSGSLENEIFIYTGSLNKFPDFFRMGTFIDSTHMKL